MSSTVGLRQRKPGLSGIVQEMDGFTKVVDNVKEEKRVSAGIISVFSFFVMALLMFGELHTYFFGRKEYDYRFTVDTDYDDRPELKMDFIVASPCNALSVMTTNDLGQGLHHQMMERQITKDPTRFEFTDEEQLYWTILRHAHAKMNSDNLRGLEELEFISGDVEDELSHLADEKQQKEIAKLEEEAKEKKAKGNDKFGGEIIFMVASGMGVFQMVATSAKDQGTACRIHGKLDVRKGKNEKILVSLSDGLVFHHHGHDRDDQKSHDVYRYFLKVVPTKIYRGLFRRPTMTYQYSVTFLKKTQDSVYNEGGIYFEYEFSATVIEIRERIKTVVQMMLRICAITGGVFATSSMMNSVLHCLVRVMASWQSGMPLLVVRPNSPRSSNLSPEDQRASLIHPNILVR